jgi:hypothetical protein
MSGQFWPCPECSRHIKRGDAICPFCGATASVDIGPTRTVAGRLSRATLFAGAMGAAMASTDCSPAPPYGSDAFGPPRTETEDASASDAANEAAVDAGDASTTTVPTDSSSAADVLMAVPLYGAAIGPDE